MYFLFISHSEQLKGEMTLKVWKKNMEERKLFSRVVKEDCLEAFSSLNKGLINLEGSNISEALGKIDIEMNITEF